MKRFLLLVTMGACETRKPSFPVQAPQKVRPAVSERAANLSPDDLLKRYGFATCLEAEGVQAPAVTRSIAFLMEVSKAPLWKFPQLANCARAYAESRKAALVPDLGIEKCLDFLESPQLAAAVSADEQTRPACASAIQSPQSNKVPTKVPALE